MKAIYKKEVRGYLTSMIGYVFIFFVLLVYGIYFAYVNIDNAYPEIGYTLQYVLFIMLIGVPILTMRVIAEERRQKTDQLLLTSPLKIEHMVLGKYLALECIFLIPVAVIALCPLILRQFGDISLPMAYTAVLGFFLLGSAQIAIGVFASSLTENQIIAAVICFIFLFLSNVIEGISGFFFPDGPGVFRGNSGYYPGAFSVDLFADTERHSDGRRGNSGRGSGNYRLCAEFHVV